MSGGLMYDGHDFGELLYYGDPEFTWLDSRPETRDVPGRDGAEFLGMTFGPASVSFSIGLVGPAGGRRDAISVLGSWLKVDEPKPLYLPDTPDRYYLAVPDGPLDLTRLVRGDMGTMGFALVDPIAYGETRSVTVPSGGSATLIVGGTAPATMRIDAQAAVRDSSSNVWGVRLDEGDFIHVDTGSSSARIVAIDCLARTCVVQGVPTLPTLDSESLDRKSVV